MSELPTIVTPPATEPVREGPSAPDRRGWRRRLAGARAWLERQPMWLFTLVIAGLSLISRFVLIPVLWVVRHAARLSDAALEGPPLFTASDSGAHVLFVVLIAAPLLESLINQSLVIGVISRLSNQTWVQIAVSALIFALMHWPKPLQMVMAITPGLALGYAYTAWRGRGRHGSYWAAVLTHFWTNGIATLIGVALGLGIRQ